MGLASQWINEGQSQQDVLDTARYFPIPFLWGVTSCKLCRYRLLGEECFLYLQVRRVCTLKMDAEYSSETFVTLYKPAWLHASEESSNHVARPSALTLSIHDRSFDFVNCVKEKKSVGATVPHPVCIFRVNSEQMCRRHSPTTWLYPADNFLPQSYNLPVSSRQLFATVLQPGCILPTTFCHSPTTCLYPPDNFLPQSYNLAVSSRQLFATVLQPGCILPTTFCHSPTTRLYPPDNFLPQSYSLAVSSRQLLNKSDRHILSQHTV